MIHVPITNNTSSPGWITPIDGSASAALVADDSAIAIPVPMMASTIAIKITHASHPTRGMSHTTAAAAATGVAASSDRYRSYTPAPSNSTSIVPTPGAPWQSHCSALSPVVAPTISLHAGADPPDNPPLNVV